jgi:hypothetical protein
MLYCEASVCLFLQEVLHVALDYVCDCPFAYTLCTPLLQCFRSYEVTGTGEAQVRDVK